MAFPPFTGFVRIFVFICLGVFVLEQFAQLGPLDPNLFQNFIRFFGLNPDLLLHGLVFQLVTWVFIHGNLSHLLFNMFAYYMFGSLLQETLGQKAFIKFNLAAAVFTALVIVIFGFFDPQTYYSSTIGASGIVFAILVAVARLFPNQVVLFAFIFPMKMKYFAYLLVGIEFYFLYSSNSHGISNIGHLGGALVGWAYINFINTRGPRSFNQNSWWAKIRERWIQRKRRKRLRIIYPEDHRKYH